MADKHERKSDKEIQAAWDEYVKTQAANKKRQEEVMRELEKQAEEDDNDK